MNKLFNKLFAVFMAFILAIAGLALKPAIPARAAGTIYFVGGCILPSCLGGSWNTGFLTLQEALATASSGDQIWVKMGTYYPDEGPGQTNNSASSTFTLKNGVEIYGGFAGTETLLSQRNVSNNLTILSGDIDKNDLVSANGYVLAGNNANHVVTASGTNSTAVLDGFLIQQGDADGAGGLNSVGGGIVNDAGSATFTNLTIFSNEAVTGGGGMYNRNSDPTLNSVSFSKNKTDNDGGGMMNFQGSSPALTNVTFDANTAGDRGGGMYNESSSSPTMSGGSMTNNVSGLTSASGDGGAMYNANGSSPTVSSVAFTSNTADNGGGMYNNNASNPSVSNLTFASNVARDSGGGMYNFDHANPVLTNVFFTANISNDSGGAGMYNQVLSAPTLTNVTFQSNQAINGYGGGMMNNESTVTLNQVVFNNNSATFDGGGMYSFSGSVITHNGGSYTGNTASQSGGGMYNDEISPTLSSVTFNGNTSSNDGGGMYNLNSNPQLTNVNFVGNTTTFKGGGMVNFSSHPTLNGGTFSSNHASWGGGMFNDASNPTITGASFQSNESSIQGGGMSNEGSSPILNNVTFTGNTSDLGGGVSNLGSFSKPTFTNVTFSGNEAANNGGGMYNNFESQPVITNATFETNQALLGGGVYNDNSNASFDTVTFFKNTTLFNGGGMYNINSSPSLVNITFSQNGASGTGGGMHNSNSHPTLTNVTFSENGGLFGAGMYNTSDSSPKLVNTLIANSIGSADCFNSSTSLDPGSSNNLIENSDNACGLVNGVNGNIIGSDPNLGLLQNNGGSTQTHALLAGSPAIDAGTSTGCPATDQRGIHRPLNGDSVSGIKCDIGSFETFPATPVFSDVPANHWAVSFIERLYAFGITGGCSTTPLSYCPDNQVTRAQMAIFLEKGIHSPFFTPANVFPTFTDTVGHFAEDWIEALKNDGVTSGCGTGIYCPENPVTRAQMAIFLLKAKHGASFSPPPATGTFADVPTSHFAAAFIEQLAAEGITSGCAVGLYCPENAVTRDQMAVFLVKAFNLP